jgi:hypothetical protein
MGTTTRLSRIHDGGICFISHKLQIFHLRFGVSPLVPDLKGGLQQVTHWCITGAK